MMTLANYGIGSSKKAPNSAKVLSKCLQIRNKAETLLSQHLKTNHQISNNKRNEILNYLSDYYSRIPFELVIWNNYQTKQCISDTILLLDTRFNPYKAREAFRLIEKMLITLIYLPWHREFRTIYTYSGLFRMSVSDPLIGVEEIFKSTGFEESKGSPMHLVLPDGKMSTEEQEERIVSVIFDCMIAQVICVNIIEVLENCYNKTSTKRNISEEISNNCDVNFNSWIQAYFKERSHNLTEVSCSQVQDLLSNVTSQLAKWESSVSKSNSHNDRIMSQSSSNLAKLQETSGVDSNNKLSTNASRHSPKQTVQDRTRDFLAQQAQDDEDLLTLPNDLLRLPVGTSGNNLNNTNNSSNNVSSNAAKKLITNNRFNGDQLDGSSHKAQVACSHYISDLVKHQQYIANELDGYNNNNNNNNNRGHQYHSHQAAYDRKPKINSDQSYNPSNEYHNHHRNATSNSYNHHHIHRSNDSSSHNLVTADVPHNDREPLIPRYDRRLISSSSSSYHNQNNHHQPISKRDNLFDNEFDNDGHLSRQVAHSKKLQSRNMGIEAEWFNASKP